MEDSSSDGFILLVAGLIVGLLLFSGIRTMAAKAFKSESPQKIHDSSRMMLDQNRRMKDIRDQHKQTMRQTQQRIRDLSR